MADSRQQRRDARELSRHKVETLAETLEFLRTIITITIPTDEDAGWWHRYGGPVSWFYRFDDIPQSYWNNRVIRDWVHNWFLSTSAEIADPQFIKWATTFQEFETFLENKFRSEFWKKMRKLHLRSMRKKHCSFI